MHPRLFWRTAFAASLVLCGVLLTVLPTATAQMPESMGAPSTPAPGAPGSAAQAGDPNAGQNSPDQTNNGAPLPSGVENSSSAFGQASAAQNGVQRGLAAAGQIAAAPASLQISLGDLLEITVFDTPELSSRLRVNNHGDILIPLAGTVHVQGLTAPEAAQAIAKKMVDAELILAPQVTVFIAEYATQGVTMAGEIRSPGVYPLLGPRTLLDMVTMAGGLGDSASKTISIIHRSDPSKVVTVRMNVSIQTPESFAAESYPIQPGDTIFVARSGIVYVVGDLKTPGGYQVEHNDRLTLLDAVALAGGPTTTSKLWDARLIRRTEHGREELVVDLKKIMYGQGPDMLLQDGDILFVPISQRKVYTAQAISAVIGAATQYALYLENR
jgi:polysaccharide export outer membrane protein